MGRTQIVAELASGHGGDLAVALDLISAAADAGADVVKAQLYDASRLADADPQKAWLTQAQVTPFLLDAMLTAADLCRVKFAVSVFGVPEVQMAKAAGVTICKVGSGDSHREDLEDAIFTAGFAETWLSFGLHPPSTRPAYWADRVVPFYSVSQYPTPDRRAHARLLQCDKHYERLPRTRTQHRRQVAGVRWGWSCHTDRWSRTPFDAIDYGAAYVERHFCLEGRGRPRQAWDMTAEHIRALREHAAACAWGPGVPEWEASKAQYIGRWEHGR